MVEEPELPDVAGRNAADVARLDMDAHAAAKLRTRGPVLTAIHAAIDADDSAARGAGMASP